MNYHPSNTFSSLDYSFTAAFEESGHYFDDITELEWRNMKARLNETPNCAKDCGPESSPAWHQNNWEPVFSCQHERRIGMWGDGGKWVCDPHRITNKQRKSCLVYSIGCDNDFTFEESV